MIYAKITAWSLAGLLVLACAPGCGSDDAQQDHANCEHDHDSGQPEADAGPDSDQQPLDGGEDAEADATPDADTGGDPDADATIEDTGEDTTPDEDVDPDAEICDDGLDNNGDDIVDCDDAACANDPYCDFTEQYLLPGQPRHGHIADPDTLQDQQFDTDIYFYDATANQTITFSITMHNPNTLEPYIGVWELDENDLPKEEIASLRSTDETASFDATFGQAGEYMVSVDDSRNLPEDGSPADTYYGGQDYTYTIEVSEP